MMHKILIEKTNNGYVVQEFTLDPIETDKWVFTGLWDLEDWMNKNFNPHPPTENVIEEEGDVSDAL